MPTLTFDLSVEGYEDGTLVVTEYDGQESLSDSRFADNTHCYGFRYEIKLASRRMDLTADEVVDKMAELTVLRVSQDEQDDVLVAGEMAVVHRVNGLVRRFEKSDTHHTLNSNGLNGFTHYALTLVPATERLALQYRSRIFQDQTPQFIITQLLLDAGMPEPVFSVDPAALSRTRKYCVQYRETDADLLHRLAAEEGWIYQVVHEAGKHYLHFVDSSVYFPKHETPILYNSLPSGVANSTFISTLELRGSIVPDAYTSRTYDFSRPNYHAQYDALTKTKRHHIEWFDAPGRFHDAVSGKVFARVQLEFLRRLASTAVGQSDDTNITVGRRISIKNTINPHHQVSQKDWMPVLVKHYGTQPNVLEEEADTTAETSYLNHFTLIPAQLNWQGAPQTKPRADGSMVATVTGPIDEEVYCDEYGRVKVKFPWDYHPTDAGSNDDHSSCWVPVATSWAGKGYGMIAIPRIGTDVVVDFIEGDPEKPIITKQAFNAVTLPPYQLPANQTKTVWRSRSHKSEGFNEVSMEDQAGHEKLYLKAQKTWLPTSSMITSPTLVMTKKSVSPMIKSPRSTTTNTSPSKANNAPKSPST